MSGPEGAEFWGREDSGSLRVLHPSEPSRQSGCKNGALRLAVVPPGHGSHGYGLELEGASLHTYRADPER